MRVLQVCHDPLPSPHTSTEQTVKAAAALAAKGVHVDLIAPALSGGENASRRREIGEFYGLDEGAFPKTLHLVERPVPWYVKGGAIRPWLDIAAAAYAGGSDYDFVLVRDPFALFTALAAGRRTVFETYRFDISTMGIYGLWRKFCYGNRNLAGFITHSGIARQALLDRGVDGERILIAHNGHDPNTLLPKLSRQEARKLLDLPSDRKIVAYVGNVGPRKGTGSLLALARALPELLFLIVGHVPGTKAAEALMKEIGSLGLNNVLPVARVSPSDVAPWLYAADCLLIPPSSAPLHLHKRTVLPMKVFLYLAAGRPIVSPDTPDIREVLKDGENALLVPPDNQAGTAAAIRRLLGDDALQETLSSGALRHSVNYTWSRRADGISGFLQTLRDDFTSRKGGKIPP